MDQLGGKPNQQAGDRDSVERRLTVIVADDDPLARRVIKDALRDGGMTVAASAATGREAVELALHYRPDIVLMDVVMPDLDGIAATRRLAAEAPEVKVVMLTSSDDHELGVLSLRVGAIGYVTKDLDMRELSRVVAGVAAGEAAVSRRLTARLIEELRSSPQVGTGLRPVRSELTSREWEVLDLLAAGMQPDAIADELTLSIETVRTHLKSLYRKLDVHSRAELIETVAELRSPASAGAWEPPSPVWDGDGGVEALAGPSEPEP